MKTYFDGSHTHSCFTKRNHSQTFLPVLCAVTFLIPCHHKVNAQEGEQSDYYCAWQGLFAAAMTLQSECYFCLHSTQIKKMNPRYFHMLNTHFTVLEL